MEQLGCFCHYIGRSSSFYWNAYLGVVAPYGDDMVVWILALLLVSCTQAPNGAFNVNKPLVHDIDPTDYPLRGHNGELHKFGENLHKMIFPRHNQRLTQYCAIHRQWENIKVVYSRDETNQYGYKYFVTKSRRRNR